jgi:preprotein translocase subunit Sec63
MKWLSTLLALAYVICPYDVFPDFFIGLGWIDDLAILGLLWWYFYVYRKRRSQKEKQHERRDGASITPHSVLGVDRNASPDEIKQAFRRLANQYHPDKVQHLGREFKELAEKRFKEIQKAYRELSAK